MNKIITYPRSGTHYLQNLIHNHSSQHIDASHYAIFDDSFIITIARDPFETIQSFVSMEKHYSPSTYMNTDYVPYYIDMYTFLNSHASIVIDYNDLISFPEKITNKVCSLLDFKEMPFNKPSMKDDKEYGYLVSSTTVKEYQEKYFDKQDIEKCYPQYLELLSKSIRVN